MVGVDGNGCKHFLSNRFFILAEHFLRFLIEGAITVRGFIPYQKLSVLMVAGLCRHC